MKNPTDRAIHNLLQSRWSPYAFDPGRSVSTEDLTALFEAARWTMSSFNAQPWRYIVGVRERNRAAWQQVFDVLFEGNQSWAGNAPVLAIGLAEKNFEHNGKPNRTAQHDLGAASACLTVEATARGLAVHQMAGFDRKKTRASFGLVDTIEPVTALAIGYHDSANDVDKALAERDRRPRERKPLPDLILRGTL